MEAQIVEEKVEQAGWRRRWDRIRAAIGDSAWGSLAGKGALYVAGFVLLAAVGSGRIRCLSGPAHEKEATAAVAPPSSASAPIATAAAEAPAARPDAGADADGGGEAKDPGDAGAVDAGTRADGKVVLNAAAEEDLRHLPGIGATRAKAILALRAKLGRFSRVEDLLKVKGIGRRSLARLRPLVVLD